MLALYFHRHLHSVSSPARFGDSGPGSSASPLGGRLSLGGHQGLLCLVPVLLELCVGAGGLQLVEQQSGASPLIQTLRWWWEMVLLSPAILFRAGCQLPRGCQHCCASGLWAMGGVRPGEGHLLSSGKSPS